eukprot:TRINITY_DN9442_c0_g3_i1.p1 TRINITY_DN9442_c0_g3~~TRINITY_DN9442_c0_g3_i1.p1  ORF type:complete len:522 (+),score=55.27 TRINITY_DN9442_c0_g3_i1:24-1589(+)
MQPGNQAQNAGGGQRRVSDFFKITHDGNRRANVPNNPPSNSEMLIEANGKPPSDFYVLPNHLKHVWDKTKPILIRIADGKIRTVVEFLEALQEMIRIHFRLPLKGINQLNLLAFLGQLSSEDLRTFLLDTIPWMARLALKIDTLFPEPLRILRKFKTESITLTREQSACLVAHMFFCTLHRQNNENLPQHFTFSYLYRAFPPRVGGRVSGGESVDRLNEDDDSANSANVQKLNCIMLYFRRLQKKGIPPLNVTYSRVFNEELRKQTAEFWMAREDILRRVEIHDEGKLEDRRDCYLIDFANKFIGGGVLFSGCVQEEVLFVTHPDLLPSILFTERLEDSEAMAFVGAGCYVQYQGFGRTFLCLGEAPPLPADSEDVFLREDISIVAIDALNFSNSTNKNVQYKVTAVVRELNKASTGFSVHEFDNTIMRKDISTGRWGCGAFEGDPQLKFLLQWMAASKSDLSLHFYRFNDVSLRNLEEVISKLADKKIGEVFDLLQKYHQLLFHDNVNVPLFDFILDFAD